MFDPRDHDQLVERLARLTPAATGRWGRMTPHQAVCHLSDWLRGVLGIRPIPGRPPSFGVRVIRFLAFTTPLPWPKGFRTAPEQDQEKAGTRPTEFEADVAELQTLLERFVRTGGEGLTPHNRWGQMSSAMWGRYGFRHVDHHLRQFGV